MQVMRNWYKQIDCSKYQRNVD